MSNIVVNEIHGQDYYNYIIRGDAGMNLLVAGLRVFILVVRQVLLYLKGQLHNV